MLFIPVIKRINLSSPRPKPLCFTEPYFLRSKYHHNSSSLIFNSWILFSRTSNLSSLCDPPTISPIPGNKNDLFKKAYKHICVYAFNKEHLTEFKNQKEKTNFEFIEDLEINRFLELDLSVNCIELDNGGKAVDTISDLEEVRKIIKNRSIF